VSMRPDYSVLEDVVAEHRYPLMFATVSGAHLYGFPSVDSDVDLRGVHVLPLPEVVGLRTGPETVEHTGDRDGLELDLVTHDIAKFCRLLLNRNGYVLEQLLSPLVVTTSDLHRELTELAPSLLTRHHAHHYLGFARTQWQLFTRTGDLKPLLYTFRVLLTGTWLMRTGQVLADLPTLAANVAAAPRYLTDLISAKAAAEHGDVASIRGAPTSQRLEGDVAALTYELEQAQTSSALPERPSGHDALHDLLLRARLDGG
jgi:predicted nucleotidyltransferase